MEPKEPTEPSILQSLLEFAFPPLCSGCGEYTANRSFVCDRCRSTIRTYGEPFCLACRYPIQKWPKCDQCGDETLPLFACGDYVDPLKQIIIDFKFRSVRAPVSMLVDVLITTFEEKLTWCEADVLVPVPLHPSRQYGRGYNQAEYIAEALSTALHVPVRTDIVVRTERRKPQQTLPARARARNIRGVFEVSENSENSGRVLIVDDVVTSGQTALEVSRVLTNSGYRPVGVISLAHGQ